MILSNLVPLLSIVAGGHHGSAVTTFVTIEILLILMLTEVGVERLPILHPPQVAHSVLPSMPMLPQIRWRIARYCPTGAQKICGKRGPVTPRLFPMRRTSRIICF